MDWNAKANSLVLLYLVLASIAVVVYSRYLAGKANNHEDGVLDEHD